MPQNKFRVNLFHGLGGVGKNVKNKTPDELKKFAPRGCELFPSRVPSSKMRSKHFHVIIIPLRNEYIYRNGNCEKCCASLLEGVFSERKQSVPKTKMVYSKMGANS